METRQFFTIGVKQFEYFVAITAANFNDFPSTVKEADPLLQAVTMRARDSSEASVNEAMR